MHQNRTILHVDDDPLILELGARKLKDLGYNVISLPCAKDVLETITQSAVRVVLLDIDLPDANGLEVLKEIKRQDGNVQVIMVTGVVDMSTVLRSMRWGAEACVFKPITDFTTLATAVEQTFAKIDRWWSTLNELRQRKATELTATKA